MKTPDQLIDDLIALAGNYNEKTSELYTDYSFITADPAIGKVLPMKITSQGIKFD